VSTFLASIITLVIVVYCLFWAWGMAEVWEGCKKDIWPPYRQTDFPPPSYAVLVIGGGFFWWVILATRRYRGKPLGLREYLPCNVRR
jgi:hypothetical protein